MKWRGNISAHTGTGEWLFQRLTAIYIGAYALYAVARFTVAPATTYAEWQAWFASGGVRIGLALFIGSILIHAWTGMRCVYLDYLRPLWLRFAVSFLTGVGLIALGFWSAELLLLLKVPA